MAWNEIQNTPRDIKKLQDALVRAYAASNHPKKMKFLYSDTQDYVDPGYDFLNDRNSPGRANAIGPTSTRTRLMKPVPYDGLLVSMSAMRQAAGVASSKVRYSTREEQRMLRDGARKFLRYGGPRFKDADADGRLRRLRVRRPSGASLHARGGGRVLHRGRLHAWRVARPHHLRLRPEQSASEADGRGSVGSASTSRWPTRRRSSSSRGAKGCPFEPLGAVQGWSPESMAEAA